MEGAKDLGHCRMNEGRLTHLHACILLKQVFSLRELLFFRLAVAPPTLQLMSHADILASGFVITMK